MDIQMLHPLWHIHIVAVSLKTWKELLTFDLQKYRQNHTLLWQKDGFFGAKSLGIWRHCIGLGGSADVSGLWQERLVTSRQVSGGLKESAGLKKAVSGRSPCATHSLASPWTLTSPLKQEGYGCRRNTNINWLFGACPKWHPAICWAIESLLCLLLGGPWMLTTNMYDSQRRKKWEQRRKRIAAVGIMSSKKFSSAAFSQLSKVSTSLGDGCCIRRKLSFNLGNLLVEACWILASGTWKCLSPWHNGA